MNYLMLVCSEDAPVPADAAVESAPDIADWITLCGASRIYGDALGGPADAKTVRVRAGKTLVTDGPYTESKEFVAGFDLLECEDLDAAINLAAAHPVAHHRMVELRPFPDSFDFAPGLGDALTAAETGPGERFLMMFCADGIPEADEVEAKIGADAQAWGDEQEAAGAMIFGNGLQNPDTATTVRVRTGGTLLSDGPFVETKEFLAGIAVMSCPDMEAAIALAAQHPLAAFHRVEVRRFMVWDDEPAAGAGALLADEEAR